MLQESINNYNSNNLIGFKPETMKADIMKFKDEVLKDFKEFKKNFDEKYQTINNEIKDSLDLFNNKLSSFNSKLLEISSQIITDSISKEKISELVAFQKKAESIMTSNKNNIIMNNEVTENRINYIEKLLKSSVLFPGLIGTNCKYKYLSEFVEYIYKQIIGLNESKEKSNQDFRVFKSKVENFMGATKIKVENMRNELIFITSDKTQKSEEKIIQELQFRDEKFKDIRIENQEYLLNLDKSLKHFNEDLKSIKELRESLESKISQLEKENDEKINKIQEKYNGIEGEIAILDRNIRKSVFHLNKNGANIEVINYKRGRSDSRNNTDDEEYDEETKKNKNEEKDEIKSKRWPKYIKTKESEITKYIKGEITADEIGKAINHHKRIFSSNRNTFEERIIEKNNYFKNLTSRANEENKKGDYLLNKKKNNDVSINDYFDINPIKKDENRKTLKLEKKMSKTLSVYENIVKNNFSDLDAKFHSDELANNFAQKNREDKTKNILLKMNKENNKNNSNSFNFTKILERKKNKNKTLNIFPFYQVFSIKNIDQNLSFFSKKNNESFNKPLSPIIKKIGEVNSGTGDNKKINIFNNIPKSSKSKISQKFYNSDTDKNNHRKISFNRPFSSEKNENT
jgi:hypothetical protein